MIMRQQLMLALCALAIYSSSMRARQEQPSQPANAPASAPATDNTNDRIKEIRRLGQTDSQAIPTLSQYLSDPDADIRAAAVRSIVRIGGVRSLDPLIRATHDNDAEIDMLATDGIVNFFLPGYVDRSVLTRPFTRGMREMRSFLSVPNHQEVAPGLFIRPEINQALADEIGHAASFEARANAARAAGILRDNAAVPALEDGLHSRDSRVTVEAIYSLQKIGDPAAGPSVGALVRDPDSRVQVAALETVGVLRSLSSAADVRASFEGARNTKVRRAALQALALLAMPGDRPLFQRYAGDKDGSLRAAALEGLGRIREPEDTPLLDAAFNEKGADWRVHLAAAFALADEGKVDASEFSPLRYLIENLDQGGRAETAQAYLNELCRREDVRKGIYASLPEASVEEKVALCSILGNSRAPDAMPVLTNLSRDPNPDIANAAAKGLHVAQSSPK